MSAIHLDETDALLIIDLQNDFLPGGALGVAGGHEVVAPINHLIELFRAQGLPIVASRDWHPRDHCSFAAQGGPWPPHCVAGTPGAEFTAELALPDEAIVVSKADTAAVDAYSAFAGTDLAARLRALGVERVTVCGLATDYCVLNTVTDALEEGFDAILVPEAMRAVDVKPGDGTRALDRMVARGAVPVRLGELGMTALSVA
ncbi:nicotinamidase [Massilia sp. WF1]|uniref:isochorismatase family protein n=1 Tax=unclassified Massilia TaxID=2609279 RepID=UPI0006496426|nr:MULTISPECIES: isochorismatase family protein [unclassified Massilia]ALK97835.1 nicotinamidase [Massilia sp. WG5]KLU35819.1 nicotinamidase [Massilia sp. WF1]